VKAKLFVLGRRRRSEQLSLWPLPPSTLLGGMPMTTAVRLAKPRGGQRPPPAASRSLLSARSCRPSWRFRFTGSAFKRRRGGILCSLQSTPPDGPRPQHFVAPIAAPQRASRVCRLRAVGAVAQGVAHGSAVALGYLVIAGSLSVKIPQIVRILKHRSVEGISMTAHAMETLTYSIGFAYNLRHLYPFSTYGELVSCWSQNVVMGLLLAKYSGMDGMRTGAMLLVFAAICKFLLDPALCSMQLLSTLQACTLGILVVGARLPQIAMNVRRGGTGELSSATYLLQLLGNLARVYTSFVLTGDLLLIGFAVVLASCNLVILLQILASDKQRDAAPQAS